MKRLALSLGVLCLVCSLVQGATTNQITQYGITWTFDGQYTYGQFANGDYWVVGPVTITSISPLSTEIEGRTMNGSMINPSTFSPTQGYDSAMYGSYGPHYSAALNKALDVSAQNPLVVATGSSLISSISHPTAGQRPQLTDAAVLTVLDSPPPTGSFRPPYFGADKTIRFNKNDLDYGKLPRLTPPAGAPAISSVEGGFARVWPDHAHSWLGRYHHPSNNMPDYGRDIALRVGTGALVLLLDYTDQEKETLLIRMTQLGIDLFALFDGGCTWEDLGGHMHGRKLPILLAGLVLGDADMLATGQSQLRFQEDRQTWIVTAYDVGRPLYQGDGRPREEYIAEDVGIPEWGEQHTRNETRDGRNWNAYYRRIVGHSIFAHVLTANILDLRDAWNWEPLFLYIDRYWEIEKDYTGTASIPTFHKDMWTLYRHTTVATPEFTPDGGTFSGGVDVEITCATSEAMIYYTTDGSTPTTTSTLYTDPVAISTTSTLKAIGAKSGLDDSDVKSATFTIVDNLPPTADAGPDQTVKDGDGSGDAQVTLDGSGSYDPDGTIVGYTWTIDGQTLATGVSPTATLGVGVHTITLTVIDDDDAVDVDTVVVTVLAFGAAVDAVSTTSSSSSGTTLSWPHTIGDGANRVLVVGVAGRDGSTSDLTIDYVSFDGVVMTTVQDSRVTAGAGTRTRVEMFYMLEDDLPPAGSYTVEVRYMGAVDRRSAGAISLENIAQEAPEARATQSSGTSTVTSMSTDITTITDGAWVVDVVGHGLNATLTATAADQVRQWHQRPGVTHAGSTKAVGAAGPTTMSWSFSGSAHLMAHSLAAFAPAAPVPGRIPGDANGDGVVDLDDFVILKNNFGTTGGATWEMGDFNGDGNVDLDDFVILKNNFGMSQPSAAGGR